MKVSILLIFVFISSYSYAQFYEDWTEPFAITDSMSINTNPDLLADTDILNGDVVIFYEKKMDATSNTQIWMRNLTTLEDEQEILAVENIDFRNPKLLVYSPISNTRCFIIYESNESGNFNIYGIEFFEDGSFGSSFQLTNTPEAENACYVNSIDEGLSICWEADNDILFSQVYFSQDTLLLEEVVTIDTNNCFEPICSSDHIFWRKMVNDSSHIYYSEYLPIGQWKEPEAIYESGHNIHLKMVEYMFYGWAEEQIIWENAGKVYIWDSNQGELTILEIEGIETIHEPAFLTYSFITDDYWEPAIFTFWSGEELSSEVFAYDNLGSAEALNISNNNYADSHTKLFMGKWGTNYFNTINIWQTEVNDNSVLYLSQVSVLIGGTNELEAKNSLTLQISPNPFKKQLEIEFNSINTDRSSLEIVDLTGNTILKEEFELIANNRKLFKWDPNVMSESLSEGIYFVKLSQGNSFLVKKVVYSK